jgi:hypothetical protein
MVNSVLNAFTLGDTFWRKEKPLYVMATLAAKQLLFFGEDQPEALGSNSRLLEISAGYSLIMP